MQTSQKNRAPATIHKLYNQPVTEINKFCLPHIQILENNVCSDIGSQGTDVSFQAYNDQIFTLESSTTTASFVAYDSPSAISISSGRSPLSSQGSQSWMSDPHHSPQNNHGSPFSGSSSVDDSNGLKHKLRELEISLLGPESDIIESCNCCFSSGTHQAGPMVGMNNDQLMNMTPRLNLKEVLVASGRALYDNDMSTVAGLMHVLEKMVSISGEPIQRLGAYVLEGLRARLESSGSNIYKALKCEQPTSSELMSYMGILFRICPYWKFAYTSANAVIKDVMQYEPRIHIIDFQIAQGTQWMFLIADLAKCPGGPPSIRITGIDDSQSNHARGGGLNIVGQKLSEFAKSCNVPFEFYDTNVTTNEIQPEHFNVRLGEALAVNFPYVLHHMPDESVTIWNHRDRLLRLVKSLSPKVVTLVEQESNTNTSPFFSRYVETLDYYTAMFESIDAACPRDDKQRINAEQHCVARDIVNMIACEGPERVERHELLGKWRSRFTMAGFSPYPLGSSVTTAVREMLKEYDHNYRLAERDGALYLGWGNRAMATSSAWR
ncbi:Scarecrow-like protein 13 [Hibiscus syriacus]|uniref:Scarecrow-like protein 13 n=1 Tax=Hibiscus syriacus TaxID=106335 RepID=A0A6A2WEH5_HIBSY|nr:scarecrow-like protein 13 [Hibiscus syriacus]KAE8655731.1 Scarecrow-like protein 13 [Hibiscus syriacus]